MLQGILFNEIEGGAIAEIIVDAVEQGQLFEQTTVKRTCTQKSRGRKALPVHLRVKLIMHNLSDDEKKCPCCSAERKEIGREKTEESVIIPSADKSAA